MTSQVTCSIKLIHISDAKCEESVTGVTGGGLGLEILRGEFIFQVGYPTSSLDQQTSSSFGCTLRRKREREAN